MLGGIILGVFRKITMISGLGDIHYDPWPLFSDQSFQLFLQELVAFLG
jgi:hypothetical protein